MTYTDDEREALEDVIRDCTSRGLTYEQAAKFIMASDPWRNRGRGPITDEMIEAGCVGFYNVPDGLASWNRLAQADSVLADKYRSGMRVALEAAEAAR